MTSGWGTVYAWLRNSTPVPRRVGRNEAGQKSKNRTGHDTAGEGRESSTQVSESERDDIIGDDTTHNVDATGQAYAMQNTGPVGNNLAQIPGPLPHTSTAVGAVGQQIAPT